MSEDMLVASDNSNDRVFGEYDYGAKIYVERREAGFILAKARLSMNKTVREIANEMGYKSPSIITRWETGKSKANSESLRKLKVILQLRDNEIEEYLEHWYNISKIRLKKRLRDEFPNREISIGVDTNDNSSEESMLEIF